jgi:hypothetical protein
MRRDLKPARNIDAAFRRADGAIPSFLRLFLIGLGAPLIATIGRSRVSQTSAFGGGADIPSSADRWAA